LETHLKAIKQTINKYTKVKAGAEKEVRLVTVQKAEVTTPINAHPSVKTIRRSSSSIPF